MNFKKPNLEDKDLVDTYLDKVNYIGCEFTFTNMFLWSDYFGGTFDIIEDFLVIKTGKEKPSFSFPIGNGDYKKVFDALISYCSENNYEFQMHNLTQEMIDIVKNIYPDKFEFIEDRDSFDYIYNSEDLINLTGKKYHSKRNHINKFMENNWSYESLSDENIDDCIKMSKEWCRANDCADDETKQAEIAVVCKALNNYKELGIKGGLIKVDDRVVAFTLGCQVTEDTFVVHIEKAFSDIQGAYPIVNREFVARELSSYKYINREEDLGVEGLRKAKLSYKPVFLVEKYILQVKE